MNVFKKIFNVSVMFTTVLWSLGVSAFVPSVAVAASCPVLNPGDEVKVVGSPAIYVMNNNKELMAYFSGYEYKTYRATYGGYISISDECYITLKGPSAQPLFVNYRPGSYVLQRESSAQLYVSEPGNTIAKITMEAAKGLYGSTFKPQMIQNAQFGSYVHTGVDVTQVKAHPGMLVSVGGKVWYVTADQMVREVTASGMTANGFQTRFVRIGADSWVTGLSVGLPITAEEKALTDKTQMGGTVVTPPGVVPPVVVSGALGVSLASDNPFAATVVSDATYGAQAQIKVLKLVFTASSAADAVVTKLILTRGGISADTDISNMYLYDGATLVASNPSVLNSKVTFTNTAGLFTVAKGSSKTLEVRLDLKNGVAAGKTLSFSVASMSDVVTSGNGAVSGSFPLTGNSFTTALVTDLGQLVFSNVSPTAAGTVDPGTTNFEVWKFKAVSTNQDVEIRKLRFTLVGSINPGDLKNFTLWDGATPIGTAVAEMASDKTITFDMSASPYVVSKGQTKNLSLRADIVGGTNRTFYASFQNAADIITYDRNYNVYLKANGSDTFTIVQAGGTTSVNWTINVGSLTQTLASDTPTGNVADAATSVTLAKFLWKANGEDVKVSSLSVSSTSAGNTLNNVRLLVDGSQVGTTISSLTANGAANTGWGSFGNSFIVKTGTSVAVTIVADLTHSSVAADETIVVGFAAGSSNAQGTVSLTNISTVAQTGSTVTVKSGTVTVSKNTAFGERSATNPTGTVNGSMVKVGSFVITSGAGEDVTVSQITLRDDVAATCIGTYMQNLTLKNAAGLQLGQTYANPSSSCATQNTYTFNMSPAFTIPNGGQYTVDVYADLKAALTTATSLFDVSTITAQGKSTGSDASVSPTNGLSLQNDYISAAGALMVQTDSDTPIATNYLMGATNQDLAKFKVSASTTEAVNITQLVVSAMFSGGATGTATGTVMNIRLIDQDTGAQVGTAVASFSDTVAGTSTPTTTYSHATFSGLNFVIPAGQSKVLIVRADLTTYQNGGFTSTGQTVTLVLLANSGVSSGFTNPVTATGASSGSTLTATVSQTGSISLFSISGLGAYASTSTLYRAKLTTAWAGDTPNGAASPSAAQTVAKFVVTNLSNAGNYTATVNFLNLNFSTTISDAAGGTDSARAMTVYKDSLSTTALATTSFAVSQKISGTTTLTDSAFTDVDIASGASKTFWVTLDTSDAASATSLSVRLPSAAIGWSDGVSTGLTAMGQDLPLIFKTFTY